jgi:hypothetical protein
MRGHRLARAAALSAVVALAAGSGCSKEKESLVLVAMTAIPASMSPLTVSVTIGGAVTKTFTLPSLSSSTPSTVGIYVPS